MTLRAEYSEGQQAYKMGVPYATCPYSLDKSSLSYHNWKFGWVAAWADAQRAAGRDPKTLIGRPGWDQTGNGA